MADVITRFKLETTQYDSALRDASKSLAAYSKQAELAGKDFDKFTKGCVEAARALGNIATSATNTKDKVKELVSAYNDVAKAYNKLTEEQKQSDFGKAMASSLEQLQGRIKDAKAEMNSTGGILGQLKDKFTVNIDALKVFSVGLQGAQAALGVARDAFFKNEEQLDTWGRVVEASESLYSGFLDALNTGDISGYLTRIGEITKAAQDAYNALDALNTFNAFNQVNVEKTRTGMTESIADYRSGQGTKEQVKAAGEAYQKELRERQKLEKQAYLEAIKKVAAERGVNGQDLITALSGSYGSYESLKAIPMSGTRTKFTPGGMFGGSTAYEEAYPVNRQEKLGAALRKLNDTELQSLQALGAQAERTGNEIAQVDKQLTRVLNGRQPGAGGGGGRSGGGKTTTVKTEEQLNNEEIQKLTQEYINASDERKKAIRNEIKVLQERNSIIKQMKDEAQGKTGRLTTPMPFGIMGPMVDVETKLNPVKGIGLNQENQFEKYKDTIISIKTPLQALTEEMNRLAEAQALALTPEQWSAYQTQIEEVQKKMGTFKGDGKSTAKEWGNAAQAITAVGSAMSSIEDPAAKVMGTIAQAIATIALTYAKSLEKTFTPWDWIAAAASGAATMISVISSIHSATGYAQGGIVKGNSYSGDNIPAMIDGGAGGFAGLNAGEIVLNKAAQGNLASQLQGAGFGGVNMVGEISGEAIKIVLNRHLKRTGQGEIVTW